MRLCHVSDLHCGFRQYSKTNAQGANVRELDVADALRRAFTDMITLNPDVVLIAGDLFHSSRPPNSAIISMYGTLTLLRAGLPHVPIIAVAGNHDTPRSGDNSSILGLYRSIGIEIVEGAPKRVSLQNGWVVTAVPENGARALKDFPPVPDLHNILLIHGEAHGFGFTDRAQQLHEDTLALSWDYVALGHYHVAAQVSPRAWYSGSIEYTSSDIWGELKEERERGLSGKGFLNVDLDDHHEPVVDFRPIATRRALDLPLIDAHGMGAQDVDRAIAERMEGGEIGGAVVRLVVHNLPRTVAAALDRAAIRRFKAKALFLRLDLRRPEGERPSVLVRPAVLRMRTLNQLVDEALNQRHLPADVDRERFRELGQHYLAEAEEAEVSTATSAQGEPE